MSDASRAPRSPTRSRTTPPDARTRLDAAVASLLTDRTPLVLAVSGGVDSMTLLDVCVNTAARVAPLTVATFDHGTGPAATHAVQLVSRAAERYGVECVAGRGEGLARDEASWRDARWRFLREVAALRSATIVTAHTRDDQVETVVMRLLRGAGVRGLSAMHPRTPVRRPFLDVTRREIERVARAAKLAWVDDPSNARREQLRNRVRLDLLPALRSVDPAFDGAMLQSAREAAELRAACAVLVGDLVLDARPGRSLAHDVVDATWDDGAAALFCQTLAERAGLALDWRGTIRLAQFARTGRLGRRIPLSGGWEAVRRPGALEIRRRPAVSPRATALMAEGETSFGSWHFRGAAQAVACERGTGDGNALNSNDDLADPWRAWLPADAELEVRAWRAGDRMISSGSGQRRVKRFLSDSRVVAADREGWPVVVADGEIVWIPGVRRALAATARPGRPRVCVVCERLYR